MGIKDWLHRKGEAKSASNITDDLRQLVVAVRADIDEGLLEADKVINLQPRDEDTPARLRGRLISRRAKVVDAQKKLFNNLILWSTLPPERVLNEVVLPALTSGNLAAQSEPCFDPVIVATYRVCQAAAQQKGLNLEAHTPPEILKIVNGWGDLYK